MGIEVATQQSPPKRKFAWYAAAGIAILIGLALIIAPLVKVTSWDGLAFSMFLVIPGLIYLVTGAKIILRVSGVRPTTPLMPSAVLSLMFTAGLSTLGSLFFLFFWVLGRSVWLNEGGDLSDFPNGHYLLIAGGCVAFGLIAMMLALKAFRIEDPPRG